MTLNKSIIKELAQAMTEAQNEIRGLPMSRDEFQQAVSLAILNKFRTGELSEIESWLGVRNERELALLANNYENDVEDLESEVDNLNEELEESHIYAEELEEQLAFQADIINSYRKALKTSEEDNEFLAKDRDCTVAMYNAAFGKPVWCIGRGN